MKTVWSIVSWFFFVYFCIAIIGILARRDDTDTPDARSGMSLYHDALTGCEYVGVLFHGFTPRLDANGKQICRSKVRP